jgi:hypothetical protein
MVAFTKQTVAQAVAGQAEDPCQYDTRVSLRICCIASNSRCEELWSLVDVVQSEEAVVCLLMFLQRDSLRKSKRLLSVLLHLLPSDRVESQRTSSANCSAPSQFMERAKMMMGVESARRSSGMIA